MNQIFAAAAGATTYSLMTLSKMAVSIMRLTLALCMNITQHNYVLGEAVFIVILSAVMLSAVMLIVVAPFWPRTVVTARY